jgi:ABC-type amino acid transport substrate-binding protein/mono/diheme cytochrome c family protein
MLFGAVLMHRAGFAAKLTVCIDQANPTSAMDSRVARAIANTQGYSVDVVPFEGYGKGGDGFPLSRFAKMAEADCALIMGFPVDRSNPNLPPMVEATTPYASTGFVLVRRGSAREMTLARLPKGSEVGIAQLDTYAGLLYSQYPNIVMHVYPTDAEMLADLQATRIAAGMAWQPTIESYEARHARHAPLRMSPLPGAHMQWNLVALYVPASREAAALFDRGLQAVEASGEIDRLIAPYSQVAATVPPAGAHAEVFGIGRRVPEASRPSAQPAIAWSDAPGAMMRVSDSMTNSAWTPSSAGGEPKAGAEPKGKAKRKGPPALYTEDQAAKGAIAYYQNCAMCHGPALDGQLGGYSGPALKGADFADPSYHFHVHDIFKFVSKQMPAATPGSLPDDLYVEIMAFILQQNGYPAGSTELTYDAADKSNVPMRYYGD